MLMPLAVLLLFIGAVNAGCYYEMQTYDQHSWPTIYILNPYNTTTGTSIKGSCTIIVNSTDNSIGFGNFMLTDDSNSYGWTISVTDSSGTQSISGKNDSNYQNFLLYNTTSSYMNITITTLNDGVSVLATMKAVTPGTIPTTTPTPIAVQTTPYKPANGLIYNPALIAADIAFSIDTNNNFPTNINKLIFNIVSKLSLTDSYDVVDKSRLAITSLSAFEGSFGPYGKTWAFPNASTVNTVLKGLPTAMPHGSQWTTSLKGISSALFNTLNTSVLPSRAHSQRVLMVIYSQKPTDFNEAEITSVQDVFSAYDIRPVFIWYNASSQGSSSEDFFQLLKSNFVAISVSDFSDSSVNTVLSNSIDNGRKLCPSPDYGSFDISKTTKDEPESLKIPDNYKGVTEKKDSWDTNNQTARYCNFYDAVYNFTTNNDFVCFRVYYELEVEKDFLRFYSGTTELVSLTGIDAAGTVFAIPKASNMLPVWPASVQFKSDAYGVYGGFYFQVYSTNDTSCFS